MRTTLHRIGTTLVTLLSTAVVACDGKLDTELTADAGELGDHAAHADTLEGEAEVLVAMYENHSEHLYYLNTDDGLRVRVFFEGVDARHIHPDEHLVLTGQWNLEKRHQGPTFMATGVQGHSTGEHGAAHSKAGPSRTDLAAVGPGLRTPMLHRVAVLMLGSPSYTRAQAQAQVNQTAGSAGSFLTENSDGIDAFEGDAFGPYDVDTSDCENRFDQIADLAKAAAAADGKNLSGYTNLAILLPPGSNCGWGGLGNVGSPGSTRQRISWYNDRFTCRLVAHELGHNLGFHHSHSTACGSAMYAANGAGCTDTEYGDAFDVMGSADCVGGHFSAPQKQYSGWLDTCEDATARGSAVVNLSPLEGNCGVRSLRIPIPGESNYYYLEYRKVGAGAFGGAAGADRVILSVSDDAASIRPNLYRLDSTPQSTRGVKDGWLTVGTAYSLPGNIQVQVLELGSVARVRVTMSGGSAPVCRNGSTLSADESGRFGTGCSVSDACPADPNKTVPGICGCGVSDVDTDRDGTADCNDRCPSDPSKVEPGSCGCGVAEGSCQAPYQGESATPGNGSAVATSNAGYTGTGYMDFGGTGSFMEWRNVNVPTAGNYLLTFRYANGASSGRSCSVTRNGANAGSLAFAPTGAWNTWTNASIVVALSAGNNTIRLSVTSSGGPNVDKMDVTTDLCPSDPTKIEPGQCGCGVPEGTCTATPKVSAAKSTFAVNESIVINFSGASGSSTDWVGLYVAGAANSSYLGYQYIAGKTSGTLTFAGRQAGNYEARLFFNDTYTVRSKVTFSVR